MYYEIMPLYPALPDGRGGDACVRLPVFGGGGRGWGGGVDECRCRRVTVENPCRPGERAEVLLGLDDCGNLVVCVRRDPPERCECRPRPPRPCPPPPCPPPRPCQRRCEGNRGRLYGSWH